MNDKRKVYQIMDTRLNGQYSIKGAHIASTLALKCLNQEPKFRPQMKEVVEILEQLEKNKDMAKYLRPNQLQKVQPANLNTRNINHPSHGNQRPGEYVLCPPQKSPHLR